MTEDNQCRGEDDDSTTVTLNRGKWLDKILIALGDSQRRYVLYYLQDEEQASLTDVTRQVVAWKHGVPAENIPDEVVAEIETMLYHNHLPKLRKAQIIEYDERSKQLIFREPPELVELCLEHCVEQDLPD